MKMNKETTIQAITALESAIEAVLIAGENQVGSEVYFDAGCLNTAFAMAREVQRLASWYDLPSEEYQSEEKIKAYVLSLIEADAHSYYSWHPVSA